jgi:hypothetical protein
MHRFFPGSTLTKTWLIACLFSFLPVAGLLAQDAIVRSPEELKELFGFCDKPQLIKRLKISPETADKIGEVDYWGLQQKLGVAANTNATYATPNEVQADMVKKYKAFLSADQLRDLLAFQKSQEGSPEPCPVTVLKFNHAFDTLTPARALILYKTPYRKMLIDKIGINGRQADGVFEVEVWKQKEALTINAIPSSNFDRIRKTVAMYNERDRRYKVIGLTEEQVPAAIQFFEEHTLGPKN